MVDFEAYPAQMRGVLISLTGDMPADDLDFVGDLIDHNEGGEAMLALANMIVENDARVPSATIREIRNLADGFIRPDQFPSRFDEQAVD